MPANPQVEAYIRKKAAELGIDPEVAVAVSKSEALNVFDPTQPDRGGDEGSSFGPFQLHYKGYSKNMPNAGLGDAFTRDTGLHASDPSTWPQQVDYALATAKRDGWRQWMGAANSGIPRWAGIKERAPADIYGTKGQVPTSMPSQIDPNYRPKRPGQGHSDEGTGPMYPPADMSNWRPARPGQQQSGTVTTPISPPQVEQYGPPMNAADQAAVRPGDTLTADQKKELGWREKLAKLASGWTPPKVALNDTTQSALAMPKAARIDQGEVPLFDPNAINNQRMQLAQAMQKLNTGKLWL